MEYSTARLVEVQRSTVDDLGGYSGFSFREATGMRDDIGGSTGTQVAGAEQLKIIDEGPVTITDQRVILQGSRNSREWAFAKLLGVWHDGTRPMTLMAVSNRQKVSGLIYAAADTAQFRYFLSLALAHYQGTFETFIGELDAERNRHAGLAPTPPVPVRPEDAPSGLRAAGAALGLVYFGRPSWPRKRRITQGIVTVSLTLIAFIAAAGASQPRQPSGTSHAPTQVAIAPQATPETSTASPTGPSARSSSSSRTLQATARPTTPARQLSPAPTSAATPTTGASVVAAPPPRSTVHVAPPPPRTSSQVVLSTCGAPANPWGYNFCGRGSLIYSPAADVCSYFSCIANFANGVGYMIECSDSKYSMSGGRSGACSYHGGEAQPVFSGSGPH